MRQIWLMTLLLLACGDGAGTAGPLELEGKSGDEAARLLATRLCERDARCGKASVQCSSSSSTSGAAQTTRCMGRIDRVDPGACFQDVFGDLSGVLSCRPVSATEATLLRACFEPLIARECLTQAAVDEAARVQEAGQSSNLNPRPPACLQIFSDFAGRCP
jgi:hypothetical protein